MLFSRRGCVRSHHRPVSWLDGEDSCTASKPCYYKPFSNQRRHYHEPQNPWSRDGFSFWWRVSLGRLTVWKGKHSFRALHLDGIHEEGGKRTKRDTERFEWFLELPPELREYIYKVYVDDYISRLRASPYNLPREPPLTFVSHLVRRESLPIFYSMATWPVMPLGYSYFTDLGDTRKRQWLFGYPSWKLKHIRHIRFYAGRGGFSDPAKCHSYLISLPSSVERTRTNTGQRMHGTVTFEDPSAPSAPPVVEGYGVRSIIATWPANPSAQTIQLFTEASPGMLERVIVGITAVAMNCEGSEARGWLKELCLLLESAEVHVAMESSGNDW